jgi:hypothetical protein
MAGYLLIDDYGNAPALTVGGPTGGASGKVVVDTFQAPTVAAAYTVGYIISSALQRPLRLVPTGSPGPYTLITGIGPATNLTQVPSGISY